MKFKPGDLVSFNGTMDKYKDVFYSGLKTKEEMCESCYHNDSRTTRVLATHPHSKFQVKELILPYYACIKLHELGDEEIPVNAGTIFIHEDEIIPYDESFNGIVKNDKMLIK